MNSILDAAVEIQKFENKSLTKQISSIEKALVGKNLTNCQDQYSSFNVSTSLLDSAIIFKRAVSQINVLIHSVGILLSLPHILENDEIIEYLSLGAGNTGRPFDLETNLRIAEFKFISWQGGPEVIRQNSLFKDFYLLAEYKTEKSKFLYTIDTEMPIKFLKSNRALKSVMSRNIKLWSDFQNSYSDKYMKVREYYEYRKSDVHLVDLTNFLPQFDISSVN